MKSHLQDSFLFLINLHFTRNCIRIYQLNLMTIPDVCFHKSLKIGQLMTHNDSHHLDENLIGCQLTNFLASLVFTLHLCCNENMSYGSNFRKSVNWNASHPISRLLSSRYKILMKKTPKKPMKEKTTKKKTNNKMKEM
jgi:hypothetical protein